MRRPRQWQILMNSMKMMYKWSLAKAIRRIKANKLARSKAKKISKNYNNPTKRRIQKNKKILRNWNTWNRKKRKKIRNKKMDPPRNRNPNQKKKMMIIIIMIIRATIILRNWVRIKKTSFLKLLWIMIVSLWEIIDRSKKRRSIWFVFIFNIFFFFINEIL